MDGRRYNIGDKVKIVRYDPNKTYKFGMVPEMRRFCGRIMTIRAIHDSYAPADAVDYRLKEDPGNYCWSISMFENFIDNHFINLNYIV